MLMSSGSFMARRRADSSTTSKVDFLGSAARRLLAAVLVSAPLAVVSVAGAAPTSPRDPFEMPVRDCPSWYGVPTTQAVHPLGPIFVSLPDALAAQLSFVTDTAQHIEPVLTFANWSCSFGVGANGTWALTSSNVSAHSQQVDVMDPMLTAGDAWGVLCGFYPAIDLLFPGQKCMNGTMHGEVVSRRAGNATYFTDPPGITGTAPGSGGRLTTMGVVIYYGRTPSAKEHRWGYGITMGCTLPSSQASTCQTLLQDFASRH